MHEQAFVEQPDFIQTRPAMHQAQNRDIVFDEQSRGGEVRGMGPIATGFCEYPVHFMLDHTPGIRVGDVVLPRSRNATSVPR